VSVIHWLMLDCAMACGLAALFGIAYTLLAGVLVGRFFARPGAESTAFPAVTIVKPLHGAEWALAANLQSFFEQDYPGDVQFLFGVHDAADPALATLDALRRQFPHAHITVVTNATLHGPNRKISNIVNMLPSAQHDVFVFADSDVRVEYSYLRRLIGELQQPGVGLVTCVYRGEPDPGFWPKLSAKSTNYQFLPGVVTGLALGIARPCFGQTIAMRRETLEQIGGFAQFARHLAEDHAIGEAVRATGLTVTIPPFTVTHACVETSVGQLAAHELRWSRTIRRINPLGHIGSIVAYPFALALLAFAFSDASEWAGALVVAALAARVVLKWRADRALRQPHRDLWLLPLWDIGSFGLFVASFLSSRVIWRGFSFNVDGDGLLSPVRDES
jgi:ceramide glucosyltransferase